MKYKLVYLGFDNEVLYVSEKINDEYVYNFTKKQVEEFAKEEKKEHPFLSYYIVKLSTNRHIINLIKTKGKEVK